MTPTTVRPAPPPWSRQRLLTTVATVTALLVLAIAVAGYYSTRALFASDNPTHIASGTGGGHGQAVRDGIAAAPMLTVDTAAMYPATPSAQIPSRLTIPHPARLGPDGVPSGYPHTAAGAVAQLGAIGTVVFTTMSMSVVTSLYRDWAISGGIGAAAWPLTKDVTEFLSGAQATSTMPAGITMSAVPSGAMIKGVDGPDWVLACVLWQITETGADPVAVGYGYCERMQWVTNPTRPAGGRWEVAPGTPAAPAPNTWPGTAIAAQAGWKTWYTPSGGASR